MSDREWDRGIEAFEAVYGAGSSQIVTRYPPNPMTRETVCHLFGKLWAEESLSIRDKRLMVLGASAMLGRADLIEIQMLGALRAGEFTDEQLDNIPPFLSSYCGAGNGTAVFQGIMAARAKFAAEQEV